MLNTSHFNVRLLGDPVLRQQSAKIVKFDEQLRTLVDKMQRTLEDGNVGVGLAAPQVGVSKRVVVYASRYAGGPGILINPEIIQTEGIDDDGGEACLSFPGHYFRVPRPDYVKVRTHTLHGEVVEIEGDGLFGRLCQHEVDHLNGKLIVDHIPRRTYRKADSKFRDWLRVMTGSPDTSSVSMATVNELFLRGGYDVTSW